MGDAVGPQIGAVRNTDFPLYHRDPVERSPPCVGQLKKAKAFARKIEGAVDAPQLVVFLGRRPSLWDRGGVDDPDRRPRLACGAAEASASPPKGEPVAALAQALEQRHIGNIGKPKEAAQAAVERSPPSPRQ